MLVDFYEDLKVGEQLRVGTYRFTEENIVRFASRFDPQPFHLSEEGARGSIFGHLCASGWHTGSAWMYCNVSYQDAYKARHKPPRGRWPEVGPSPGFQEMRWPRPVYAGDEVTYTATLLDKRPLASRPGWGMMSLQVIGRNQRNEEVISFKVRILVEMFGRGEDAA
ncbi:MaoC family dehydratase [Rhodoligotrophos defluvii]|uniref:MaoC family dehydratase n=1 Tax=Rhodoligotrophos defluvii TaxID=2561934 RepID=UPI0010CA1276|nr:MaoC family dehydratase [Rhodoligotrophos defluvii]